jgi:hypothetical protein
VAAAGTLYERATGRKIAIETAPLESASSASGADVVVGADLELHRIIESGASHPDLDVDVARVPWVLVSFGTTAGDVRSLAGPGGRVLVPGGAVGRAARRALPDVSPERLQSLSSAGAPPRLEAGDAVVLPLSMAGVGTVSPLPLPPLTVRALGVRGSGRADAARAFLDFLVGERGNGAFRACGRAEAR